METAVCRRYSSRTKLVLDNNSWNIFYENPFKIKKVKKVLLTAHTKIVRFIIDENDEEEENGKAKPISWIDYTKHCITLPWRLLFAFIPPAGT